MGHHSSMLGDLHEKSCRNVESFEEDAFIRASAYQFARCYFIGRAQSESHTPASRRFEMLAAIDGVDGNLEF